MIWETEDGILSLFSEILETKQLIGWSKNTKQIYQQL